MNTIVYRNGGAIYLGEHCNQNLSYWKWQGRLKGQSWLYKGYRYYGSEKDIAVVFDTKQWDKAEIAKRKANGFLGIKEYKI